MRQHCRKIVFLAACLMSAVLSYAIQIQAGNVRMHASSCIKTGNASLAQNGYQGSRDFKARL
jgi:hypothetical protein